PAQCARLTELYEWRIRDCLILRSLGDTGDVMPKPEMEFHRTQARWVQPEDAAPGVWEQQLSHDPETGDTSLLQRYDPGTRTTAGVITHEFWEEVLLLEGDLRDITLNRTFTAGMYACRPPGMRHGPYLSTLGCLMFVNTRYPTGA
ncbi:cupin domain-containing protein, partial [Rhodococcus jostii]